MATFNANLKHPKVLGYKFANSPLNFKINFLSKNDSGDSMKTYAEEGGIMSQPRKMLISGFTVQNAVIFRTLLLFYLDLNLVCIEIHSFVEYTASKCFNSFVQSNVDVRRQGYENPRSSDFAERMKLLANSSHGYEIMDRSRHTLIKTLHDENTHTAIISKLFKKLKHLNNAISAVEFAKAEVELKEPTIFRFFILRYAKRRMLELY